MDKVYGHPASHPRLAALLERDYAAGSHFDRTRYHYAAKELSREARAGSDLVAQLVMADAPEAKIELAQASSEARISALNDDLRRFAPPDAASVQSLREKHRALQARAAEGPGETAPCIVRSAYSGIDGVKHWAMKVDVDQSRPFGSLLEMSEFLDQQDENQRFVLLIPYPEDESGYVSCHLRKGSAAKVIEELRTLQIGAGLILTPCTPVIVDHTLIESRQLMWGAIARHGGPELLDLCPDLYRPDRSGPSGEHYMHAVVEKTPKGEVMRGFAGEAPDLEGLIVPAVNAALARVNGPDSDGARDRGTGSLLDRVAVREPFSGPEKEGAAHTL